MVILPLMRLNGWFLLCQKNSYVDFVKDLSLWWFETTIVVKFDFISPSCSIINLILIMFS